eukprot:543954-Heterocapsa_arctica.AAC.1
MLDKVVSADDEVTWDPRIPKLAEAMLPVEPVTQSRRVRKTCAACVEMQAVRPCPSSISVPVKQTDDQAFSRGHCGPAETARGPLRCTPSCPT